MKFRKKSELKKKKAALDSIPIAPEDWNFRNCPDEELFACTFYEYARDSPLWLKLAEKVRDIPKYRLIPKAVKVFPTGNAYQKELRRWQFSFVTFFALFPEFPKTPWLKLDSLERERRLFDFTEGLPARLKALRFLPKDSSSTTAEPTFSFDRFEAVRVFFTVRFQISWDFTDDDIIASFTSWLRDTRKKAQGTKRMGKRPTQPDLMRARLRELGAKRLLSRLTVTQAAKLTKEVLLKETREAVALHGTVRSWRRAKKNAELLLKAFDEYGLPISDPKGPTDPVSFLLGTSKAELWKGMLVFRQRLFPMTDDEWWWWTGADHWKRAGPKC